MNEHQIKTLLEKGKLWDKVVLDELGKKITGEIKAREIIFLCGVGRLVENAKPSSFNLIFYAGSSAGKDWTIDRALEIFLKESTITRTRISPTTLNYWHRAELEEEWTWNGKNLVLKDTSENVLNSEALKLMCSDGSKATITIKNKAEDLTINGKPSIFVTTAFSIPSEEQKTRFSMIKGDESEEQTKHILKFISNEAVDGNLENYDEGIVKFLENLKPCKVKIPFARKIDKHFPTEKIKARRGYSVLLDYIKAVACFHQEERTKHRDGSIDAELEDYQIAKNCYENLSTEIADLPFNTRQKNIIEVFKNKEKAMEVSEIQRLVKPYISEQALRPHLTTLSILQVLEKNLEIAPFGREVKKYTLSEEFRNKKPLILPNSDEL